MKGEWSRLWGKERVSGADTEVWNHFRFLSLIVRIPKLALATVRGCSFMPKVRNPTQERKHPNETEEKE